MSADTIARLKITLDDVKPTVLRWIDVPLTIRLDRLHLAIQAAMGWTNTHLYEIRAGDVGWGDPDPDGGDGPLDARKARLIDVLEDVGTKTLRYLYDFGDGWEHTINFFDTDVTSVGRRIWPWVLLHSPRSKSPVRSPWSTTTPTLQATLAARPHISPQTRLRLHWQV